ncbi:Bug family tripartite tricarboxylate transporter substrate binding protein [Verminephrobacter eiseniae]|uniref:Bug family tripartite tricarboxylate transporter substrate binding protein n=1 Tax=Verminephrobacter eiseniae TaxID=364317 RepID=UPI002238391F|nr:tripartite tricarboxylate transporter substrate binding protein [Verminephrobacter eiseniae]MCW5238374.1 tripartite tricarboxylate transporter substrate binding protein [Verminephrobacter eiseniae]
MNYAAWLRLAAACSIVAAAAPAPAQSWPSRPIKLLVPYSPGGLPDTVARVLSLPLQTALGQSVVVENKPGAGGAVAATVIAQSPADGYTLLLTDGPMLAITPLMMQRPAYDAAKDFAAVALVGTAPLFLAANARLRANTLAELVAQAKAEPGVRNYGSSGIGSIHHLSAEAMKAGLGIELTHIPFRGSGNSVPAMVGGDVDLVFASPPSLMGFVKSGQAKLLAINSARRSPLAPEVPTLAETIPGFDFAFTVAVLAKTGTPPDLIDRISAEIGKIVRQPEIIERLHKAGVDPIGTGPQQLAKALRAESARITAAAKLANLQPE